MVIPMKNAHKTEYKSDCELCEGTGWTGTGRCPACEGLGFTIQWRRGA